MAYRIIKNLSFILVVVSFVSSCYYDIESELYGTLDCPTPEVISYADDLNMIIIQNCATSSCHSSTGSAPGDFSTYDGVKQKVDDGSFQFAVIEQRIMPPSGPLNPCDIHLLQVWIERGANNN